MNWKLSVGSLALCALLGLNACSSDSSSSPEQPVSSSGGVSPDNPVGPSSSSTSTVGNLAAAANPSIPVSLYGIWKGFHYTTQEEEAAKYPSLGADFGEIFKAYTDQGLYAARIIWSTYQAANCVIAEANGTNMYKRGCTVSEGIGYGMLITLFAEDWDAFNRLWIYSTAYRNSQYAKGTGLMPWLTVSFSWDIVDDASATDADLDIATSLVIAYYKTGNQNYLNDALTLINAIWTEEINPSNLLIYSGDTPMWKTADPVYNLSYFSPVALRLFAMVDPGHDWTGVLNAGYAYMQKVQAAGTGVFPDWSNGAGVAVNPNNNSADKTYWSFNKESVRIPWRIAWDYYWFQDERAASVLNTLNAFIAAKSGGDPSQIPAVNYSWNLSAGEDIAGLKLPTQWSAAWCATGIAGNAAWLESCTNLLNATEMATSSSSYFSNMLQMMYSQLLNGMYTKPF